MGVFPISLISIVTYFHPTMGFCQIFSARDFFGCSQEDLDQRDAAISASRAKYEQQRSKELSLGPPIGTLDRPARWRFLALQERLFDNLSYVC